MTNWDAVLNQIALLRSANEQVLKAPDDVESWRDYMRTTQFLFQSAVHDSKYPVPTTHNKMHFSAAVANHLVLMNSVLYAIRSRRPLLGEGVVGKEKKLRRRDILIGVDDLFWRLITTVMPSLALPFDVQRLQDTCRALRRGRVEKDALLTIGLAAQQACAWHKRLFSDNTLEFIERRRTTQYITAIIPSPPSLICAEPEIDAELLQASTSTKEVLPELQRTILLAVSGKSLMAKHLENVVNCHPTTLRKTLSKMVEAGILCKLSGEGYYDPKSPPKS